MALSEDQKAMLRLLAQREQGYEDMAALMGVSVEELRSRVKDALSQLESEGQPAPKLPEPPPAEQAKPAAKAAAGEKPAPVEPALAPPESPATAEPPELSATPPSGKVPPSLPPDGEGAKAGKSGISFSSNGTRVALAAIVGAVVIVVVLLLVLGGGGGGSSTTATTAENATTTTAEAGGGGSAVQEAEEAAVDTQGGKEATKALLTGAGEAKGIAVFGRVKNKLALQIVAEGLEPLAKNEAYAIWVAESPQKMLPLAASPSSKEGVIATQFEVPNELLGYLANETFDEIAITKIASAKLDAALKEATKNKETPSYTGTPVIRGTITGPIIGAAQREEEEKGKEGKAGE